MIKSNLKLFVSLNVFWIVLSLDVSIVNLYIGMIVAALLTLLNYRLMVNRHMSYDLPKTKVFMSYSWLVITKVTVAALQHAKRVLMTPEAPPKTVRYTVKGHDPITITLLANLITQTPGTMTIDITDNVLTILAMDDISEDQIIRSVEDNLASLKGDLGK